MSTRPASLHERIEALVRAGAVPHTDDDETVWLREGDALYWRPLGAETWSVAPSRETMRMTWMQQMPGSEYLAVALLVSPGVTPERDRWRVRMRLSPTYAPTFEHVGDGWTLPAAFGDSVPFASNMRRFTLCPNLLAARPHLDALHVVDSRMPRNSIEALGRAAEVTCESPCVVASDADEASVFDDGPVRRGRASHWRSRAMDAVRNWYRPLSSARPSGGL